MRSRRAAGAGARVRLHASTPPRFHAPRGPTTRTRAGRPGGLGRLLGSPGLAHELRRARLTSSPLCAPNAQGPAAGSRRCRLTLACAVPPALTPVCAVHSDLHGLLDSAWQISTPCREPARRREETGQLTDLQGMPFSHFPFPLESDSVNRGPRGSGGPQWIVAETPHWRDREPRGQLRNTTRVGR